MKNGPVNIDNKYTPDANIVNIDTFWGPNEYSTTGEERGRYFNNFLLRFISEEESYGEYQAYIGKNNMQGDISRDEAEAVIRNIYGTSINLFRDEDIENSTLEFLAYYNFQRIKGISDITTLFDETKVLFKSGQGRVQSASLDEYTEDYKQRIWEAYAYMRTQQGTSDKYEKSEE